MLPWLPDGGPAAPPPRRRSIAAGAPGRVAALLAVGALALAVLIAAAMHLRDAAGQTVSTPFLSYTAPAGWSAEPSGPDGANGAAPLDVPALIGLVHGPQYACGGETFLRGFAATALMPTGAAAGTGPVDRAQTLARWFAAVSYATPDGAPPEVTAAAPRPVRVAGPRGPVDGTVTEVTAQAGPGRGDCPATEGTVLVLAAPVSGGAALLLVAGDTAGGPAEPAPPEHAVLDAVLDSVRLSAP
jgi:hypothetical protein